VADFNGDGKQDLVVGNGATRPSTVSVLLGNGDGTFQTAVSYPFGKGDSFVAVGDFNGDRRPDLIVADALGNAVGVLLNTGVVSFSPTTPFSSPHQLIGTTSAPQTVTLTNTGTTALSITSLSTSGPFQLTSGTTCSSSVAPGGKCAIAVTFHPVVEGLKHGLVSISGSASIKPQAIELTGSGTVISVSPPMLTFPPQKVGTKSAPQTATVTNTSSTTVNVTSVRIAGKNGPDFSQNNTCGTQIGPGANCTVTVTFTPSRLGARTGVVDINDTGGGSPQGVLLSGTGN
jgi:FG-GAP-like repeat/Abnormal spindle-like microcephaly-assoc'd, ASPM-SPD-2-Hydin/HYDIN/CFA65/VesB-like, Ig-like domain